MLTVESIPQTPGREDFVAATLRNQAGLIQGLIHDIENDSVTSVVLVNRILKVEAGLRKLREKV